MSKLNQVIAIEKGVKSRVNTNMSTLYKAIQKPTLFDGFVKNWEKSDEDGENRPPERKRVQLKSDEVLDTVGETLSELFDVTAQKDFANCKARANVVVGGKTLLTDVPATYLLFLEKQLNDVKTLVGSIPTLSADEDWHEDKALGLFKTEPVITRSTAKVQEPIILAQPTKEHPAQTQLITKDVVVGHWNTVNQSGAAVGSRKKQIVRRVETLIKAVKYAREEANETAAPQQSVGSVVFDFLFGE
ncbi:MAG: hypothetical protein KAU48_05115 [Candidatus Thorarchaeota archaeon]|nr:hypothetical protein [Candidatus Thorarchaeota archaeon]